MNRTLYQETEIREKIKLFKANNAALSNDELNQIKIYLLEYKSLLSEIKFFEGTIKDNKIVSCFCEAFYEELVQHTRSKLNASITMLVNLPKREVRLYKNTNCTLDFKKLCQFLFNEENSESSSSEIVGTLTTNFLKLSKQLTPCS